MKSSILSLFLITISTVPLACNGCDDFDFSTKERRKQAWAKTSREENRLRDLEKDKQTGGAASTTPPKLEEEKKKEGPRVYMDYFSLILHLRIWADFGKDKQTGETASTTPSKLEEEEKKESSSVPASDSKEHCTCLIEEAICYTSGVKCDYCKKHWKELSKRK